MITFHAGPGVPAELVKEISIAVSFKWALQAWHLGCMWLQAQEMV
jgi:hypothetical protein